MDVLLAVPDQQDHRPAYAQQIRADCIGRWRGWRSWL